MYWGHIKKIRVKRRAMAKRRLIIISIPVIILGTIGTVGTVRALRPVSAPVVSLRITDLTPEPVSIEWNSSGIEAVGASNGPVLAAGPEADTVVPTASIAKLITILTVLQKHPLKAGEQGPTVTLSDTDIALYQNAVNNDGSAVAIETGEQISEYQMIQAMLLPSANNMADSLAVWAFGSLEGYRAAAQTYVLNKGMSQTIVGEDASGLSPTTTSTARDLVKLGQLAYAQPVIREIAGQRTATIPVAGEITSTNDLLGQEGVNGLKTGTGAEAGYCYLVSANHKFSDGTEKTFIGVVMNAESDGQRFSDAQSLLAQTYENVVPRVAAAKGQSIGTITTAWGETSPIVVATDLKTTVWRGSTIDVSADVDAPTGYIGAGQAIGQLKAGNSATRVSAKTEIHEPSLWWRIWH